MKEKLLYLERWIHNAELNVLQKFKNDHLKCIFGVWSLSFSKVDIYVLPLIIMVLYYFNNYNITIKYKIYLIFFKSTSIFCHCINYGDWDLNYNLYYIYVHHMHKSIK